MIPNVYWLLGAYILSLVIYIYGHYYLNKRKNLDFKENIGAMYLQIGGATLYLIILLFVNIGF